MMNSKISAVLGAAFALLGVSQVIENHYVWAVVSFIVAVFYGLRANELWKSERT